MKQLDPNHLVTVGEDGFYSSTTWRQDANPVYEPSESLLLRSANLASSTEDGACALSVCVEIQESLERSLERLILRFLRGSIACL